MRILVVEDSEERLNWFRFHAIGIPMDIAKTAAEGIEFLKANHYTQIFLDHDLNDDHYMLVFRGEEQHKYDHETGFAVAKFLGENPDRSKDAEIFVHTLNDYASRRMVRELHSGRRRYKRIPFTALKATRGDLGRKERSIWDY